MRASLTRVGLEGGYNIADMNREQFDVYLLRELFLFVASLIPNKTLMLLLIVCGANIVQPES